MNLAKKNNLGTETKLHPGECLSPLDGRYSDKLDILRPVASEFGLMRYRVKVEAEWLLHLAALNDVNFELTEGQKGVLKTLSKGLTLPEYQKIKAFEAQTNHDVKACEYFLRDKLEEIGANSHVLAHVHFACTSEDINNLAYGLIQKEVRELALLPKMSVLASHLKAMSRENADQGMISRTHGQTATPTTLGRELAVFVHRLNRQIEQFRNQPILGKINGAVGAFNAHLVAYPSVNWEKVSKEFVEEKLSLDYNPLTTQIENHDSLVEYFDILRRQNTILIDLSRDIWSYISLGYFSQMTKEGEVGSSTMPHKVNPIDFENAEGNFGIANAFCQHFSDKLQISRLQRDLSDSTVLRNIGVACGHTYLGLLSLIKGFKKLKPNRERMQTDLAGAPEVLAEAIQTVMRSYGVKDSYERLKEVTRGKEIDKPILERLVRDCEELPENAKNILINLSPRDYLGLSSKLALEV